MFSVRIYPIDGSALRDVGDGCIDVMNVGTKCEY